MDDRVICHLVHSLHVGGAEMLVARLARRLRDRCRFLFVCLDELGTLGAELRAEGFPVEVLGRRPGLDWRCVTRLSRLMRQLRVALIHAHNYSPFSYALMARLLYRRPPVLFTEHGRHHPDRRVAKRVMFNRLLLQRRDRVIGVGAAVRQALILNEGMAADRVGILYNGIDPDQFASDVAERATVRRQLGLGPDDFVILQVARLDPLKDHATAIRMMQRVTRHCPSAKLLLVGDGPKREIIEAQIEQCRLHEQVRLLGVRQDVAQLLAAADLFLLTSISEGIPLTLIEAMAAGLPVVSTRVGGTGEVVGDGETGLLAPANDDAALSTATLRFVEDPGLRQRMGEQGRVRARSLFSEARMAEQYRDLYKAMLDERDSEHQDPVEGDRHERANPGPEQAGSAPGGDRRLGAPLSEELQSGFVPICPPPGRKSAV
jgi:sugar transferase (PEP-CTERM/EpsH1 system associated)